MVPRRSLATSILIRPIFTLRSALIITLLSLASMGNPSFAAEFKSSKERLSCNIGAGSANRIEFENSKILEVIGNSAQYSLVNSHGSKYVFLTPKLPIGKTIEISIIYGNDQAQELSLVVTENSPQSIVIKQGDQSDILIRTKPQESTKELAELIRFMALSKKGKYDVEEMKHKLPPLIGQTFILTFDQKYSFASQDLIGRRLTVKNNSKVKTTLSEEDFGHIFENIIAINLSKVVLKPKEEGQVYLISKTTNLAR